MSTKVADAKGRLGEAMPDAEQVRRTGRRAADFMRENHVPARSRFPGRGLCRWTPGPDRPQGERDPRAGRREGEGDRPGRHHRGRAATHEVVRSAKNIGPVAEQLTGSVKQTVKDKAKEETIARSRQAARGTRSTAKSRGRAASRTASSAARTAKRPPREPSARRRRPGLRRGPSGHQAPRAPPPLGPRAAPPARGAGRARAALAAEPRRLAAAPPPPGAAPRPAAAPARARLAGG